MFSLSLGIKITRNVILGGNDNTDDTHVKLSDSACTKTSNDTNSMLIKYDMILEGLISCKSNVPLSEDFCIFISNESNYLFSLSKEDDSTLEVTIINEFESVKTILAS